MACVKRSQLKQHDETAQHIKNRTLHKTHKQQLLTNKISQSPDTFNEELCEALLSANIPWVKLNNPQLRGFLEKYTKHAIPDESSLRKKYLEPCYIKVCF